ncbi:Facilitated trehalose transporter Tret1 [Chionoecetes opilio]|uniref:Facilitated trehalose transporter Tret1 n=1 Tax=Chionoecetes opilio TaxID=41210 RepID=A0A8J5CGX0_CHIOP|nr:Facilitated trehalose transporter Tret1 [Chionoecetes opilio]
MVHECYEVKDLQHKVLDLKNNVKVLQKSNNEKQVAVEELQSRVAENEHRVNYQEDYSRRNNLRIIGLKEQPVDHESEEEPPGERRRRLAKQMTLVLMLSMGYVALGATLTWPSPALSSLDKDNATLVGTEIVLNAAQKDMTGSLIYLGSLFGSWIGGWLVSRLGRRLSLGLMGLPFALGWVMTGLAPNTALLLIGRLIQGVANGCLSLAGYAYVVELPDTSIRGMMAVLPTLGVVVGSLYTVAAGYALPWHYLSFVAALPCVAFVIASFFLPESPSYLVVQGHRQAAISLLRKLRGNYVDIEAEVTQLERMNSGSSGGWRGLLDKDILHRMVVVVMTFLLSNMCGNFIMMIYTTRILQDTGAPMDPDAVTAITGVLRVAGTVAAVFLLDVLGRRYCLLLSHAVNATCMLILGTYVFLAEHAAADDDTFANLSWVPMVCVMISLFFGDIGVHPIPFIISSEYFPTNIRAQASSVCLSFGTAVIFAGLQLYSPMLALLTQPGLYWFFGCSSIVGVLFALFAIIETKGKAVG